VRFDVVVVGAGLAGLYLLHRLRRQGLTVRVLEAGGDVGGTWYWNRYPGARCDVESVHYSYSFSPALEQEWDWTERFASQPEILRYLGHVADRFDLRRDISFDTRVVAAHYEPRERMWVVHPDRGAPIRARYCVMATGCLSVPALPAVPGIGSFRGIAHHTARWPHNEVPLAGKRVGIIGTGSSGVQTVPIIARQAAELTVFQRTPAYSAPAHNRPTGADELAAVKAHYPELRRQQRESGFGVPNPQPSVGRSALAASAAERRREYERRWAYGSVTALLSAYDDLAVDEEANGTAADFVRSKIRDEVRDPKVAMALSPSYPLGTKRLCLDSGYYATYNRDNTRLVDLRESPLLAITERGVRTSDAEYRLDVLVYATGFDAMTGALSAIDIRGEGGTTLADKWATGPRTYLGLAVAGFPNLFLVTGPGSPSVLSNMAVSIEQHVEWIADCLDHLRRHGLTTIAATGQDEDAWCDHVDAVAGQTLYPRTDSWYTGANVPGKPRAFMPYYGGVGGYRRICDRVAAQRYRGFTLTA
jgi:cyclohexanone monooxygenase